MGEGERGKESIPIAHSQSQPDREPRYILMPTGDNFAYKRQGYFQLVSTQSTTDYSDHRLASAQLIHHDWDQQQYGYYG